MGEGGAPVDGYGYAPNNRGNAQKSHGNDNRS